MNLNIIYASLTVISLAGWTACAVRLLKPGLVSVYVCEGAAIVTVALLVAIYFRIIRPMRVLASSMDMLKAGDWNSHLRHTGQHEADAVADTFNALFTRLHEQRTRLQEQENLLNLMVQSSPSGIVILDAEGGVAVSNPPARELLKIPVIAETIAGMSTGDTVVKVDGRSIGIGRHSFVERGIEHPFFIFEDLSVHINSAESRAYEKIIRVMAHEVNNTMGGLRSALDIASEELEDDSDMNLMLRSASERATSLASFITRYADVVRLPSPQLHLCDLNAVVSQNLPFLQSLAAGKDISVNARPHSEPVNAMIDTVQLGQVLVNAVKNAIESITASGTAGGRITVTVDEERGAPRLTVSDNGPGLSESAASNVFTPFFTDKPNGQGCGLTQSAEIARRHNATISLRTDSSDGITRLTITFPRP